MKLKIISNGTERGTYIVDANTGEKIDLPLASIKWKINVGDGLATAQVVFQNVAVEVNSSLVDVEIKNLKPRKTKRRTFRY